MTSNVNIDENINTICMFAFRYALGRRTFAPNIVTSFLSKRLDILSDFTLNQMLKEISECPDLGDECDKITWAEFDDCLRGELFARESKFATDDGEEHITWKNPIVECGEASEKCKEAVSNLRNAVKEGIANQLTKLDNVNHPSHYTDGDIEVIDYIEDKKLGYHLGNVVKYVSRAGKKDASKTIEDLKKARWYLDRYITNLEEENETKKV